MNFKRLLVGVAALCLVAGSPAATLAQTSHVAMSQAAHVTTAHPIKVNACNPERNVSYNYAGYTPGFYPRLRRRLLGLAVSLRSDVLPTSRSEQSDARHRLHRTSPTS